ncbi:MAG: primosomal protein N' [Treponema sp.]|nr:primosomal protein N' [Treponema sp.]
MAPENGKPYLGVVFDLPLDRIFSYRGDTKGEAQIGKRVMVPFGRSEKMGYVIEEYESLPPGIEEKKLKAVRRVVDARPLFDGRNITLSEWISRYYLCGRGEALAAMLPSGKRAGASSSLPGGGEDIAEKPLLLSEEQRQALDTITAERGEHGEISPPAPQKAPLPGAKAAAPPSIPLPPMFYLYGITGSGKTEVFLRAAEYMIKRGLSVIYLVPEISLTHQTAEAIGKRFGHIAATLHSGMSRSMRLTEWMRIKNGDVRIVAGPRSAVFAPVRNLGLIIIDEEHDGSYKSGNTPRYHARQVAMRRCSVEGASLVMGSATPSAEAWKLMQEKGITRLNLTRRLSGGSPPEIRIVSLENTDGCLSKELKDEIWKTARMGRQTILFLNRRGFAYFYHCRSCGFELVCKNCSVSLTWHKGRNRAICHYCGYQTEPPKACPQCGSLEAGYSGFGTEMIEEEVRRTFPELRILRADADSTQKKGSLEETLVRFKRGEIDLLLGTQMVAKGLNFPGVRLVGVVLADTGLHIPDFRAAERTFSLIVQVAGRSGRYFPDGTVIVQTLRPEDPAITRACALDIEGFFKAELKQRDMLGFPPYSRLIRFTVRSTDAARADKAVKRLADFAGPLLPRDADMLGPAECPIGLIANNYRFQIIVRGKTMGSLHACAAEMLKRYDTGKDQKVYLEVDVDPVSLM